MSTNINETILKKFIINTNGSDKLTQTKAQKLGIDFDAFKEANVDENTYLELDEILDNDDLYEQFATMYVEELDKEQQTVDAEKEKEEANKVKDKGESKA